MKTDHPSHTGPSARSSVYRLFVLLSAVALCVPLPISAQEVDDQRSWGVVPIPIVGYSPDFGGIFGLAGILFYGPDVGVPESQRQGLRNNQVIGNVLYTTNGSFVVAANTINWLAQDRYLLDIGASASRIPRFFFGIGPRADDSEEFQAVSYGGDVNLSRALAPNLFVGPLVSLDRFVVGDTESDGTLSAGTTDTFGLGARLFYDSTGGVFFPRAGARVDARVRAYPDGVVNAAPFSLARVEGALYREVWLGHVVALQGVVSRGWGDIPVDALPALGGDGFFRGYLEQRFRDDAAVSAQVEYRAPIAWRIGVVGFVSVGQVGRSFGTLELDRPKIAGGGGLRIRINDDQELNLRIDIAFTEEGRGTYFNAREAF